ncbi:MAG: transglycosylase SLT domain-containing protein [Clostridia bacterium]
MKRIMGYLAVAIVGGLIVGTLALWAVEEGLMDNPFSRLTEAPGKSEMHEGPELEGAPGMLWPAITLEWARDLPTDQGWDPLSDLAERQDAVGYEASLQLARRASTTDPERAEELFRRAQNLLEDATITRELAELLAQTGEPERAAIEYRSLLPAEEAVEALLDLGLSRSAVTTMLGEEGYYGAILDLLEEPPGEPDASFHYGRALYECGEMERALDVFRKLDARGDERGTWWLARTMESLGRVDSALAIYRALGPEGGYRAGMILEDRGLHLDAAESFVSGVEAESVWRGARIFDEEGMDEAALEAYLRVSEMRDSTLWDDAAYRAFLMIGEDDSRGEQLLGILEHRPAWMIRLGREPTFELFPELVPERPDFLLREEVYQQSGRVELASLERRIGERHVGASGMLYLGLEYLQRGEYERAVRWGSELVRERPCPAAYRVAYPRAFEGAVRQYADRHGLDPHLVWAVMREESRFQPQVVSWAGAVGLMQIMPGTGRDIAARLGDSFDAADLRDPETNLRYGTWYLARMLDEYGTVDVALAAYNAGGGNASRWLDSPLGSDPSTFPTAVTFRETRLYITRVADSRAIYDWLYKNEE